MKYLFIFLLGLFLPFIIYSEESWILPLCGIEYTMAEEIFLNEGMVPPLEEKPVIADDLIYHLKKL